LSIRTLYAEVKERANGAGDLLPRIVHDRLPNCSEASTMVRATSVLQVQNDRVIVTEWRFEPGAETGDHVHAHDYVVVPLTSGTLRLVEPQGTRDAHLEAGASYARPAGVAHNVINANAYEFRFVEVELIQPSP
jgi:quercetin dioxygenase-like cupin family protein